MNAREAQARRVRDDVALQHVKPGIKVSAAVFKNAVHSSRFIGQDWRRFAPWVQYAMPMNYRGHFPDGFERHLDLMEETIASQKEWARDYEHLWIGISIGHLREEGRDLARKTRDLIAQGAKAAGIRAAWDEVDYSVKEALPDLDRAVAVAVDGDAGDALVALDAFIDDGPTEGWHESKLTRTLERVRSTGVEGIVLFAAGAFLNNELADTVGDFFGE